MNETFPQRLRRIRESKRNFFDRKMSQRAAAELFRVSLSCYQGWERTPCRSFPDAKNRALMEMIWPEIFSTPINTSPETSP